MKSGGSLWHTEQLIRQLEGAASPRASSGGSLRSGDFGRQVRSRFGAHPALKTLKLSVDTHDGVVTLRGQVNNVDQRGVAQLEARAVQGVKVWKNELSVR